MDLRVRPSWPLSSLRFLNASEPNAPHTVVSEVLDLADPAFAVGRGGSYHHLLFRKAGECEFSIGEQLRILDNPSMPGRISPAHVGEVETIG